MSKIIVIFYWQIQISEIYYILANRQVLCLCYSPVANFTCICDWFTCYVEPWLAKTIKQSLNNFDLFLSNQARNLGTRSSHKAWNFIALHHSCLHPLHLLIHLAKELPSDTLMYQLKSLIVSFYYNQVFLACEDDILACGVCTTVYQLL